MPAKIISGKDTAKAIYSRIKEPLALATETMGRSPSLHVILVGLDPASDLYVRNKERAAKKVGITCEVHRFPCTITTKELIKTIDALNKDDAVDGIIVQLPLPLGIDEFAVLEAIHPCKDVDCMTTANLGFFYSQWDSRLAPCTAKAVADMIPAEMIPDQDTSFTACVIGRSDIVGKPTARLLLDMNYTVTTCHSHTPDIGFYTRNADVVVVAAGKPGLISDIHIKPGAVVIDVGINRDVEGHVVGDVDYESVSEVAGYITPVPGGVGVVTVAELMLNTVLLCIIRSICDIAINMKGGTKPCPC